MRLTFVVMLLLCGCTRSEVQQKQADIEKKIEVETVTEQKKGVEAGQQVDLVTTRKAQKDTLTEREARLQATTTSTVTMPAVPIPGIMDAIGGLLTGNWGTAAAALASLLAGKVIGRKASEAQTAEITEGIANFSKENPEAAGKLSTHLSMAMSKSTKKTVRRIKP